VKAADALAAFLFFNRPYLILQNANDHYPFGVHSVDDCLRITPTLTRKKRSRASEVLFPGPGLYKRRNQDY
jgi:hypothetical protein